MSPKYNDKDAKEARLEDERYNAEDEQEKQKHKKKIKDNAKETKKMDRRI
jgi:hypothetical protein